MDSMGSNDVGTSAQPVNHPHPHPHPHPSTTHAAVMYTLSLVFLCLTGCMLPHGGVVDPISHAVMRTGWMMGVLVLIWVTIVAESVHGARMAPDGLKPALIRLIIVCLMPPCRLAISPAIPNQYIWLPRQGWLRTGQEQLECLESRTAWPMLMITLLILPVIGAEMLFKTQVEQSLWLMISVYLLTALIWVAFAFEFILLVSVAEDKMAFCKANWLNIVIILLPLIAFLRTLRLFRFLRVANASKLMRAYRLRGLTTRARQLALLFNLVERLMQRNPQKYCGHLEAKIRQKEGELEKLRAKLQEVQTTVARLDHGP